MRLATSLALSLFFPLFCLSISPSLHFPPSLDFFSIEKQKKSFFVYFSQNCIHASHRAIFLPFPLLLVSFFLLFFQPLEYSTRQRMSTVRGNRLNAYKKKRKRIAQARLLVIIAYSVNGIRVIFKIFRSFFHSFVRISVLFGLLSHLFSSHFFSSSPLFRPSTRSVNTRTWESIQLHLQE